MRALLPFLTCVVALPLSSQSVTSRGSLGPAVELDLAPGRVWLVPLGGAPLPQPTIQAAIDAASEGDTVLLSDGIFQGPGNRDLLVSGKDLMIQSENGPARTILDCEYRGRGITFAGAEVTNDTLLRGITLVRGDAALAAVLPWYGGGVLAVDGAAPVIEQCTVAWCRALIGGGGISLYPPAMTSPVVRDCMVLHNSVMGSGAGNGGGVQLGNAVVERCTIVGNRADGLSSFGGGVWALPSSAGVIRDSLIARNTAPYGGGMLAGGYLEISGCTIVDNQSTSSVGGGIVFWSDPDVVMSSSIVWGNLDPQGKCGFQIQQGLGYGISRAVLRHCAIEGGASGVFGIPLTMPILIAISSEDPAFAAPAAGDYRLSSHSPCIDAGDPEYLPVQNEGDIEVQPRSNGRVDIGADEHWPGLALSLIQPGRAGVSNRIETSGGPVGALVLFFAGLEVGLTSLSFGACPSLELSLEQPQLLGVDRADASGRARYAQLVPASLSGTTLVYQALSFDPLVPAAGCDTTGVVRFLYP